MSIVDELLRGPRGRRMCLAYAMQIDPDLRQAVFWTAHRLDPNPGRIIRFFSDGSTPSKRDIPPDPVFTESDIAALIERSDLASLAPDAELALIRDALRDSVDSARYWQEPDGNDVVAGLPALRGPLARVASYIVERGAPALPDLTGPAASDQWAVQFVDLADSTPISQHPAADLAAWATEEREADLRAEKIRRGNFSGEWWSVPTQLLGSRPNEPDALEFVEDAFNWQVATAIPLRGGGRILEIDSAEAWAELCRRHPLDVSSSRQHDWFRVTGREGRWLMPDWRRVAGEWDAVHLTTLAYLSAATRLIPIDDEYASVIGGWAPDATIWLGDTVRERDEPRREWTREPTATLWTVRT